LFEGTLGGIHPTSGAMTSTDLALRMAGLLLLALARGAVASASTALRGRAGAPPRGLQGSCSFDNPPTVPHFWDPTCPDDGQSLGCLADGTHANCRFCGASAYASVYCPASFCQFDNQPHLPYYWDTSCSMGQVGCLADGKNIQCRFCGEFPYNGTVSCPADAHAIVPESACQFENEPAMPYFWDATCADGDLGCKADGVHLGCRFCGKGIYQDVTCPASLCTFEPRALLPAEHMRYYWDTRCWSDAGHVLGCLADNFHPSCRYCGFDQFANITCPPWALHR